MNTMQNQAIEAMPKKLTRPRGEKLKAERVQEKLRSMPGWRLVRRGKALYRMREFPDAGVASAFASFAGTFDRPRRAAGRRHPLGVASGGHPSREEPRRDVRCGPRSRQVAGLMRPRANQTEEKERKKQMPRVLTRQADVRKEAEDIYASLVANEDDLPHLKMSIETLGELNRIIRELTTQQVTLRASKQSVSKELDAALNQVRKQVTFLQTGLRQHYGSRSEKLVEFGIRPLRPRIREDKPQPTPEAPPETPEIEDSES